MSREDDTCRNCGLAIRTGHLTYSWFHTATGNVQCPVAPIQPIAAPRRGATGWDDWDCLEDQIYDAL
jgi:hypothetical protein